MTQLKKLGDCTNIIILNRRIVGEISSDDDLMKESKVAQTFMKLAVLEKNRLSGLKLSRIALVRH